MHMDLQELLCHNIVFEPEISGRTFADVVNTQLCIALIV